MASTCDEDSRNSCYMKQIKVLLTLLVKHIFSSKFHIIIIIIIINIKIFTKWRTCSSLRVPPPPDLNKAFSRKTRLIWVKHFDTTENWTAKYFFTILPIEKCFWDPTKSTLSKKNRFFENLGTVPSFLIP